MNWRRSLKHLPRPWQRSPALTPVELQGLAEKVKAIETQHLGEVRICIERHWPLAMALSPLTVRERALQVFAELGVWDTAFNTGVLIYLDMADRTIELVADRGLNAVITAEQWRTVLAPMQTAFAQQAYAMGLHACLDTLDALLATHLPPTGDENENELPNFPLVR